MTDRICVSVNLAAQAIKDNDMLEALAVAALIKRHNKMSILKNATVRTVKEVLHVGTERALRILNTLVGYQERKETGVIFNILSKDKYGSNDIYALQIRATSKYKYNYILEFKKGERYTVTQVMDMIRSCILANAIKKQSYIVDANIKARDPQNMREKRSGEKRLKRLNANTSSSSNSGNTKMYNGKNYGFSYSAVMRATNTKRSKAKRLIKGLVAKGVVLAKEIYESTGISVKEFDRNFARNYRDYVGVGRLFARNGEVYLQLANQYEYVGNIIR